MNKSEKFDGELQELARFAKVLSHPARLAILKFLAEARVCISGDISDFIPLGRTTVSQHLKELKDAGLISGEIDGLKISYCINNSRMKESTELINKYFCQLSIDDLKCCK